MIIGLHGKKGSGKDTVAAYLIKQHRFERKAFADPLKRSVAALLDIPYKDIDRYKNNPNVWVSVRAAGPEEIYSELSFREFLQRYGTESHRDVFGENFWVEQTLPRDGYYAGKKIVLTDVRFASEAQRISQLGGFTVEIERPDLDDQDQHASEQPLPPTMIDYVMHNNSSIEDLWIRVETMLGFLGDTDSQVKSVMRR